MQPGIQILSYFKNQKCAYKNLLFILNIFLKLRNSLSSKAFIMRNMRRYDLNTVSFSLLPSENHLHL